MANGGLGYGSAEEQQLQYTQTELQNAINELNAVRSAYVNDSTNLINEINAYYLKRGKHLKG